MRKYKIYLTIIGVIFSLFASISALADYAPDVVVSLQIDNPIMEVNGIDTEIDSGRGTAPIIIDGRTLVPIRAIIESFGGAVNWNGNAQEVALTMSDDTIKLTINSNIAYLNDNKQSLDVAPTIINERTMLPIRFIAEGFNLGVAWDSDSQTVSIIRDSFTDEEYQNLISVLPRYSGLPYTQINDNSPYFKDYEIISGSFEYYSNLDELGRCDVCMASVAEELMPTGERESISSVTPTGWINKSYDFISGKYLYNRCHLIGYQLTGENANERNLITGTRYLNVDGMLPFENMVDDYVDETGNHVMYRSTPVFSGNNLVADGVLMEAYSVEDNGQGISFCVYCYNVQPDIIIDYATGENSSERKTEAIDIDNPIVTEQTRAGLYRTPSGKRYHFDPNCGGKNSYAVTMEDALSAGLTPCAKCVD